MPRLSRWFIKSAFLYLLAALLLGAVSSSQGALQRFPWMAALTPVYFHLFMVGWVTQLIFGVVYWMFPKYSKERPRGSEALGRFTFFLLNVGLLARGVAEPLQATQSQPWWGWLLALSAWLQWLAGMAFLANTWGRVKEK